MEQAMEALLERNLLQFENDTRNAGHDLWPAQRWLGEAIAPLTKQQGLIRLAVECDARVSELRNRLDDRAHYADAGSDRAGEAHASRRAGAARQREIKRKRPPAGRAFLRSSSRTTRSTSAQSFWLLSLAIRSTS